jgi:hypothetical protein
MSMGRCQECGRRKKKPKVQKVPLYVYEADPYCSRGCAELAHGVKEREGLKS